MKYRDYFSLKTLHRFGVEPDRPLTTDGAPEEVKSGILSAFGKQSAEAGEFLAHKTDCALLDMRIGEREPERVPIEVSEAMEDFVPAENTALRENDGPTMARGL